MGKSSFGCKPRSDKIGILIAQLGTPEAPSKEALIPYLREFLSDPRVIEDNRFVWWFVLNFIVLRSRPERSAALYKRIWTDEGSPLLVFTEKQRDSLRNLLSGYKSEIEIEYGMRYGSPSLEEGIDSLIERGCSRLLLFPMYPQYSATTTASTYDVVFSHLLKRRWVPTLRVAEPYYRNVHFINAQAEIINKFIAKESPQPEYLVLSYHGIPQKYVEKGDPYCCMCHETTAALIQKLSFPAEKVIHTFQSRFGSDPWLTPYTDETIIELGKKGVKHIAVAAPGFTADCLETLDELGNEGSHAFKESGGDKLSLIPCLNDDPVWMEGFRNIILDELGSWLSTDGQYIQNEKMKCSLRMV